MEFGEVHKKIILEECKEEEEDTVENPISVFDEISNSLNEKQGIKYDEQGNLMID